MLEKGSKSKQRKKAPNAQASKAEQKAQQDNNNGSQGGAQAPFVNVAQ